MTARGLDHLRPIIGKTLTAVKRLVLHMNDFPGPFEHGVTELSFGDDVITVAPGPNEDYLAIEAGPIDLVPLQRECWTSVELGRSELDAIGATLRAIEVFDDGYEDVALLFEFDAVDPISIVLVDGDVVMGEGLERFDSDPNHVFPFHRLRMCETEPSQ